MQATLLLADMRAYTSGRDLWICKELVPFVTRDVVLVCTPQYKHFHMTLGMMSGPEDARTMDQLTLPRARWDAIGKFANSLIAGQLVVTTGTAP